MLSGIRQRRTRAVGLPHVRDVRTGEQTHRKQTQTRNTESSLAVGRGGQRVRPPAVGESVVTGAPRAGSARDAQRRRIAVLDTRH